MDTNISAIYIGLTENEFITRHRKHTASFHHKIKNCTELSKPIWTLKDDNLTYDISWSIISHSKLYNIANKKWNISQLYIFGHCTFLHIYGSRPFKQSTCFCLNTRQNRKPTKKHYYTCQELITHSQPTILAKERQLHIQLKNG